MTTVFLSGSRKIGRIGDEIRQRIDKMVANDLAVVTGDANGADKAMQGYLAELKYRNVTIYFVGDEPRNNVGRWPTKNIAASERLSGRDFYAQKDLAMAKIADFGFVLWDGKSSGSVQNMVWLLAEGKKAVVYLSPEGRFHNIKTQDELVRLLMTCEDDVLDELERKIQLPAALKRANRKQPSLNF
jgi:hypothetical protein